MDKIEFLTSKPRSLKWFAGFLIPAPLPTAHPLASRIKTPWGFFLSENMQVTICPPKFASGYKEMSWDEFRVTGGRYVHPKNKDNYTKMQSVRANKLIPIQSENT